MPLIKWEPLFPEWEKWFRDFGDFSKPLDVGQFVPSMDMYEENGKLIVEMETPSVKPEDVEISVKEGYLYVSGKTEKRTEVKEDKYYRKEIKSGSFSRTVALPQGVIGDKAEAEYEDGVLRVIIPMESKKKNKEVKKIKVKKIAPRKRTKKVSRD